MKNNYKYFIFLIIVILFIGSINWKDKEQNQIINVNEIEALSENKIIIDQSLGSNTGSQLIIDNNRLLKYDTTYNLKLTNNSSVKYILVLSSNEFENNAVICEPNSTINITGNTLDLMVDKDISVTSKDGSKLNGYVTLELLKN